MLCVGVSTGWDEDMRWGRGEGGEMKEGEKSTHEVIPRRGAVVACESRLGVRLGGIDVVKAVPLKDDLLC